MPRMQPQWASQATQTAAVVSCSVAHTLLLRLSACHCVAGKGKNLNTQRQRQQKGNNSNRKANKQTNKTQIHSRIHWGVRRVSETTWKLSWQQTEIVLQTHAWAGRNMHITKAQILKICFGISLYMHMDVSLCANICEVGFECVLQWSGARTKSNPEEGIEPPSTPVMCAAQDTLHISSYANDKRNWDSNFSSFQLSEASSDLIRI